MLIEIYTKESCPFCENLKLLLQSMGKEYTEYSLYQDFSKEQFMEKFEQPYMFPRVLVDGNLVGGYTDFVHFIRDKQL